MGKSKISFIQTGDWHLGQTWPLLSSDLAQKFKTQQIKLCQYLAEACRDHAPDFVILTGDIFDQAWPSQKLLSPFLNMIEEIKPTPILIAPGNHDPILPGSTWLGEEWPNNVYIFSREQNTFEFPHLDTYFSGLAFERQTALRPGYFPDFGTNDGSVFQVAVAHGDIVNIKSRFRPISEELIRSSNADYFALGHNHEMIIEDKHEVPYGTAGSPIGRSFLEAGSRSFLLGELSGELVKGGRANLDLVTRKQTQKLKQTSLKIQKYPVFLPAFIRLKYECDSNDTTADIIRGITQKIKSMQPELHPDSLWQIILQGKKSLQADAEQILDYFSHKLLSVEIRDDRYFSSFPGQGQRLLFPGLSFETDLTEMKNQSLTRRSKLKKQAVSYLISATNSTVPGATREQSGQDNTVPGRRIKRTGTKTGQK